MSATGTYLIARGEAFLSAARMHNTTETWEWLMQAAAAGDIDLDTPPTTPEARGQVVDLFDDWADAAAPQPTTPTASRLLAKALNLMGAPLEVGSHL